MNEKNESEINIFTITDLNSSSIIQLKEKKERKSFQQCTDNCMLNPLSYNIGGILSF
ncbi:MAG: hypothetical protein HeimC3_41490 [Candidatus Heimdallarchaeota archaeon LC_3]|nr:MAG: hypothetical protein HeimC3_41490 [Candidatus Heimdallarchaeota archaeon LC_3]